MPKPTAAQMELLLMQLYRAYFKEMRQGLVGLNCSFPQMEVLKYLSEHGPSSMKEVAAHLSITPPSATSLGDALLRHGLIARTSSPKDRRAVLVSLAPKAIEILKAVAARKVAVTRKIVGKLSGPDQAELFRLLTLINTTNTTK